METLEFELRFCLRFVTTTACYWRERGGGEEKGYKRADGELCHGGHLVSKLKIRTRSERIFLLLELRAAVWERRFGRLPEGWYF